jgi:hypothetical protein
MQDAAGGIDLGSEVGPATDVDWPAVFAYITSSRGGGCYSLTTIPVLLDPKRRHG